MIEVAELVARVRAETSEFTGAMDGVESRVVGMGSKMTAIGATLSKHLTLPLVAVGAVSGDMAIKFQNAMELIHTQAGVSQSAVDQLSGSVLKLAGPTATAPEELSTGLYHLASQGLRGAQALDALKNAAEGAKMGGANLEDVTNALGAVLASKISGVKNYGQAMGELNATVGAGDMRMQDLADAMGTGLPAKAAVAGVSLRDVSAALAVFGDNNIRGAQAGTLLNSTMRLMEAPSGTAAKAFAKVGLSATALGDTLRSKGIVAAVSELRDHLSGLSKEQQTIDLTRMFGGRQSGGVQILIDQLGRLKTKVEEVGKGGSSFASNWEDYTKTTSYHLASMGAQMQATGITIGDVLLPVIAKVADVIGNLVSKFQELSPHTRDVIIAVAGVAAAIGPVVSVVGALTTAFGVLLSPVGLLVAGIGLLVAAFVGAVLWPDKMTSVLEKMGLSAHAAGEIVQTLRDVFHVVETAAMSLVNVVRDNWTTIRAIIVGVVQIVEGVIGAFVAVAEALWHTFGSTIVSIAETYWGYVKNTIKNALDLIKGVIDVVLGIIHGNWSQAWNGIKEIVSAVWHQIENVVQTAAHLLGELAKLAGEAILHGILEPIAHLAQSLWNGLKSAISTAIHAVAGWVVGEAEAIGSNITHGIISGIGGLGGSLFGKLKGEVGGALGSIKGFLHINSPSLLFANEVGSPIGEGIIKGFVDGSASLPSKMEQVIQNAINSARTKIQSAQQDFQSAWSSLTSEADNALSGIQGAKMTPTEALLAREQQEHNTDQLKRSLDQANQQLADALAGKGNQNNQVDPAQVAQAQQAVNDAKYAILVDGQQKIAAAERLQLNAQQQLQKQHFDAALAALQAHLAKEHVSQKKAQDDILKLFKKYGVSYHAAGVDLGTAFATGLHETVAKASKEAHEVGQAIINGIKQGMAALEGVLEKEAEKQAFNALKAAKKALGIKSPSQVFADEVGAQISAGIAMGIGDKAHLVDGALADLTSKLPPGFSSGALGEGQATLNVTQVTVPNATFLNGNRQELRQFAQQIQEFLD